MTTALSGTLNFLCHQLNSNKTALLDELEILRCQLYANNNCLTRGTDFFCAVISTRCYPGSASSSSSLQIGQTGEKWPAAARNHPGLQLQHLHPYPLHHSVVTERRNDLQPPKTMTLPPSSRKSCRAWKWKTLLSKRLINSCNSRVKENVRLFCWASTDEHTRSKPIKSSPLVAKNPHISILVEVTLEKVNHGKLKFTMVNGTASVTPNF